MNSNDGPQTSRWAASGLVVDKTSGTAGIVDGPAELVPDADGVIPRESGIGKSPVTDPQPTTSGEAAPEVAWMTDTRNLVPEQLDELAQSLVLDLHMASSSAFEARFGSGQYEVIGRGKDWDGKGWDESLVMQVQQPSTPDGEIRRVTLSESEYPEFYAAKRQILWVRERAKALRAELRLAQKK